MLDRLQDADRDGSRPGFSMGCGPITWLAASAWSPATKPMSCPRPASPRAPSALRRELITAQRDALTRLLSERRIGVATSRTLEHELDLEEARLG